MLQAHCAVPDSLVRGETLSIIEHIFELNALCSKTRYSRTRVIEIATHYAESEMSLDTSENAELVCALKVAATRFGLMDEDVVTSAVNNILGPIGW